MPAIPDDVPAARAASALRSEPLDPPIHRHVVDLHAALGQELFHVTVGEAEPQVPPDRQGDDLRREPITRRRLSLERGGSEGTRVISWLESA